MGVYIPKAELPTNCFGCLYEPEANCDIWKGVYNASDYKSERYEGCPLVEVAEPHGDLVDKNEIDVLTYEDADGLHTEISAPTVIEAEGE